jgi:phenylalanyl-tRNA synthetase alpha chain
MWVSPEFNENDLFSIIREVGGDLIEAVNLVDVFVDKASNRTSKAYRINFRSLERTLTNDEITKQQF